MRLRIASLAAFAFTAVTTLSLSSARAAVETFDVDAVHSTVLFRVKHANTSWAYGRFNGFSGKIGYDAAKPEASTVTLRVDASTVDTGDKKRDEHLRNADFFDCAKFPEITFTSTAVKKSADGRLEVTGDLSLHGVTKPVTIAMEVSGTGKGRDGESLIGFEGTFQFKRSDFGMTKYVAEGGLGDEVRVTVAIEASHK